MSPPQHGRMIRYRPLLLMVLLLCGFPVEAHAWGLVSHVAYTQQWLHSLPHLPLAWISAVQRYPSLVLAGACLPDLAVVSRHFTHSHGWGLGQALLHSKQPRQLALGIGYNIHLLSDVVAHQHFVPTFEAKWRHDSLLTHAAAEWAMDAYCQHPALPTPSRLLRLHRAQIVESLHSVWSLPKTDIHRAVSRLATADQALRWSRLPHWLLKRYCQRDNEFVHKLAYYQTQVSVALHDLPHVLAGQFPALHAEHVHLHLDQLDAWRRKCLQDARLQPTRAIQAFEHYQHQWSQPSDC